MRQFLLSPLKKGLALLIIVIALPVAGCSHPSGPYNKAHPMNANQSVVIVSALGPATFQSYTKANCWKLLSCPGDRQFNYTHKLDNFNLNAIAAARIKNLLNQRGFQHVTILYLPDQMFFKQQASYGYSSYNYAKEQTARHLAKQLHGTTYDYVIFISRASRPPTTGAGDAPNGTYGLWQLRIKKKFQTFLYWDYSITLFNHNMNVVHKETANNRILLPIDSWIAEYSDLSSQDKAMMTNGLLTITNTRFNQSIRQLLHQ
ncbi:MAG: hypothetical protein GY782_04910 [Gammaproteobacteria bacterium]|nr:hypothetical protein [Gammaproteobacteria bacterium]